MVYAIHITCVDGRVCLHILFSPMELEPLRVATGTHLNYNYIFITSLSEKSFEYIITSSFAPIHKGLKLIHMQVEKKNMFSVRWH